MDTQDREKREITTSHGFKVVVKTYATAREMNAIEDCYTEGAKMKLVGSQPQIEGFDVKARRKAEEKQIEMLVVSVNGETDPSKRVAIMLDDMPVEDYNEVMEALEDVAGKKKEVSESDNPQNVTP